jgi:molybdopterin-guanine dinucleotide biosynthesis protein A
LITSDKSFRFGLKLKIKSKNNFFNSAVILAGGKSSRLGFDKQQLQLNGESVVLKLYEQLGKLFPEVIIMTNKPDLYKPNKLTTISDIYKDKGPIAGIHAALATATSEYYYVTACDMPILNIPFINYMKKLIKKSFPDILCSLNERDLVEPFNGFYSKNCLSNLTTCIINNETALFKFIRKQNSQFIGTDMVKKFDPGLDMFKGVNKREDMENNDQ